MCCLLQTRHRFSPTRVFLRSDPRDKKSNAPMAQRPASAEQSESAGPLPERKGECELPSKAWLFTPDSLACPAELEEDSAVWGQGGWVRVTPVKLPPRRFAAVELSDGAVLYRGENHAWPVLCSADTEGRPDGLTCGTSEQAAHKPEPSGRGSTRKSSGGFHFLERDPVFSRALGTCRVRAPLHPAGGGRVRVRAMPTSRLRVGDTVSYAGPPAPASGEFSGYTGRPRGGSASRRGRECSETNPGSSKKGSDKRSAYCKAARQCTEGEYGVTRGKRHALQGVRLARAREKEQPYGRLTPPRAGSSKAFLREPGAGFSDFGAPLAWDDGTGGAPKGSPQGFDPSKRVEEPDSLSSRASFPASPLFAQQKAGAFPAGSRGGCVPSSGPAEEHKSRGGRMQNPVVVNIMWLSGHKTAWALKASKMDMSGSGDSVSDAPILRVNESSVPRIGGGARRPTCSASSGGSEPGAAEPEPEAAGSISDGSAWGPEECVCADGIVSFVEMDSDRTPASAREQQERTLSSGRADAGSTAKIWQRPLALLTSSFRFSRGGVLNSIPPARQARISRKSESLSESVGQTGEPAFPVVRARTEDRFRESEDDAVGEPPRSVLPEGHPAPLASQVPSPSGENSSGSTGGLADPFTSEEERGSTPSSLSRGDRGKRGEGHEKFKIVDVRDTQLDRTVSSSPRRSCEADQGRPTLSRENVEAAGRYTAPPWSGSPSPIASPPPEQPRSFSFPRGQEPKGEQSTLASACGRGGVAAGCHAPDTARGTETAEHREEALSADSRGKQLVEIGEHAGAPIHSTPRSPRKNPDETLWELEQRFPATPAITVMGGRPGGGAPFLSCAPSGFSPRIGLARGVGRHNFLARCSKPARRGARKQAARLDSGWAVSARQNFSRFRAQKDAEGTHARLSPRRKTPRVEKLPESVSAQRAVIPSSSAQDQPAAFGIRATSDLRLCGNGVLAKQMQNLSQLQEKTPLPASFAKRYNSPAARRAKIFRLLGTVGTYV